MVYVLALSTPAFHHLIPLSPTHSCLSQLARRADRCPHRFPEPAVAAPQHNVTTMEHRARCCGATDICVFVQSCVAQPLLATSDAIDEKRAASIRLVFPPSNDEITASAAPHVNCSDGC
jgi:hypothetical protein